MKNKGYYLAGTLFLLLCVYRLFFGAYIEATMYLSLAIGFGITGIIKNELYLHHGKLLGIISWVMIFIALLIFLYLLRMDAY